MGYIEVCMLLIVVVMAPGCGSITAQSSLSNKDIPESIEYTTDDTSKESKRQETYEASALSSNDDYVWNGSTRFPLLTYASKRHAHFQLDPTIDYDLEYEDRELWNLFATKGIPWEYLNSDGETDYYYYTESASTSDLSGLGVYNCTAQEDNTVSICCLPVVVDNQSINFCHNVTQEKTRPGLCPQRSWEPFLKLVCIPIICIFGICGNTISFIVMCSGTYHRKSYGYYLRALALFDNLTLIINLVFTLNDVMFDMKEPNVTYTGLMSHHTAVTCKITEFMRHVIYLMSSWLVVCFTVDRFIAVCFPLLRVRYCTEKSAICTIAGVLSIIMISQSYHLVFVDRLDRSENPHVPCHAPIRPDRSVRLMYFGLNYFWFSFLLRFALPFLVVAFCNACIIYHIERMKLGRQHCESRRKQKASLAIYTLYAVCACFVVTLLPNAVVTMIQFVEYVNHQRKNLRLYCMLQTVYTPFDVLRFINYSANFVLYGLTGQQFRRELVKLIWCCLGRLQRGAHNQEPIPLTSRKNLNSTVRQKLINGRDDEVDRK